MTAVTLLPGTHPWGCVWETCGYNISGVVILLWFCSLEQARGAGLLVGNHIVDASSLVSLYPPLVQTPFERVCGVGVWCKLSAY